MRLDELLLPDAVKTLTSTSSKKRLFHELGDMAHARFGLQSESVADALMEREGLGPTGVGHGIALPHARMQGLDAVRGLFVRLEKPLDFDAVDRQPVDLVFALLAPLNAGVEHLKALALVSRTMRERGLCTKLRANEDPAILHTILTQTEANQAA